MRIETGLRDVTCTRSGDIARLDDLAAKIAQMDLKQLQQTSDATKTAAADAARMAIAAKAAEGKVKTLSHMERHMTDLTRDVESMLVRQAGATTKKCLSCGTG